MGERSMSHPDDWQREATAYHEAGHAVVRYLLAFEPKSVTISSTRNAQNAAKYGDPLRGIRLDTDGSGRARLRLEKAIRISYAGPLAEKKYSVLIGEYLMVHTTLGELEELGLIARDSSRRSSQTLPALARSWPPKKWLILIGQLSSRGR